MGGHLASWTDGAAKTAHDWNTVFANAGGR
jgi:hypothetical protein